MFFGHMIYVKRGYVLVTWPWEDDGAQAWPSVVALTWEGETAPKSFSR